MDVIFEPTTQTTATEFSYDGNTYKAYSAQYIGTGYKYAKCIQSPLVSVTVKSHTERNEFICDITFNLLIPVNLANPAEPPLPYLFVYGVRRLDYGLGNKFQADLNNSDNLDKDLIVPQISSALVIYASFLDRQTVDENNYYTLYTLQATVTVTAAIGEEIDIEGLYAQYLPRYVPLSISCELDSDGDSIGLPDLPVTKRGTVVIVATS